MHEELLAHQDFLERLARRLARDESAAADLVQDTWLRALARPPREAGAWRAWLATVAGRLAGEARRGRERRDARELHSARAERTDGGLAEVDRRLDFQTLLLERLRALPEVQRHALALRFVEDLGPAEIAARLGVPLETVKARLRRGLATLRADLDRASGGERSVWKLALLPELGRGSGAALGTYGSASLLWISMTTTMKLALAVVAISASAGILWVLGSGGSSGKGADAPQGSGQVAGAAEERGAAPARSATAAPAGSADAQREQAAAPPEPRPTDAADPRVIPVRVVERSSGRPLSGAEVRWLFRDEEDAEVAALLGSTRVDALLAERGELLHADTDGWARIPRQPGELVLTGCAPGLWAFGASAGDAPGELRLELVPDVSVDVLVRDARGEPAADVPVAWLAVAEHSQPGRTVRTDEHGRARLLHAPWPRTGRAAVSVVAAALVREPVQVTFELDAPPAAPIELALPPTGVLEVHVRGRDGLPVASGDVSVFSTPAPPRPGEESERVYPTGVAAPIVDGRARFAHVAPGMHLRVLARTPGANEYTQIVTAGPAYADELRTVELVVGEDHPILRVQAVDGRGEPLGEAELRASLAPTGALGSSHLATLRTDDAGVFLVHVREPFERRDAPRTLRVWRGSLDGSVPLEGTLALAPRYEPGLEELGRLVLAPAPLLAAGLVLDEDGEPLAGASVQLRIFDEDQRWPSPPRPGVAQAEGPVWRNTERSARTDELGRFELHGELPPGRIELFATHGSRASAATEVERGARDVRLQLVATGTIAGQILIDDPARLPGLRVAAHRQQASGAPLTRAGEVRADGTLVVPDLPPGRWTLHLRSAEVDVRLSLREVEDIEVRAGEATRDPRLLPLDLRGLLRPLRVELVVPAGAAAPRGRGEWREVVVDGRSGSRAIIDGVVEILRRDVPLDVGIVAQGYRQVVLEGLTEDRVVELEPGLLLRLRIPAGLTLPAPRRFLANVWYPGPLDITGAGGQEFLPFDEHGELALRIGGPGGVHVLLQIEPEPGSRNSVLVPNGVRDLDVPDGPGEHLLILDVTRAQLDAALERLGG